MPPFSPKPCPDRVHLPVPGQFQSHPETAEAAGVGKYPQDWGQGDCWRDPIGAAGRPIKAGKMERGARGLRLASGQEEPGDRSVALSLERFNTECGFGLLSKRDSGGGVVSYRGVV